MYVANVRQAILKGLKDAYQKTEIVRRVSYGGGSYFRDPESDSEPKQGAKKRRDGEQAAGSNEQG